MENIDISNIVSSNYYAYIQELLDQEPIFSEDGDALNMSAHLLRINRMMGCPNKFYIDGKEIEVDRKSGGWV